jgi:hypothetical protein
MPNSSKVLVPTGHDQAIVVLSPPREGDCIGLALMAELQRRLLVFTLNPQQQIVRSVQPPSNKTLYWIPIDENGKVVGVLQGYDPATGQWIPVSAIGDCISQAPDNLLQLDSNDCLYVPAGNVPGFTEVTPQTLTPTGGAASVNISYAAFTDQNAEIGVNFQADPGAGARWWVSGAGPTGCTVNFASLGGSVAVLIFARRSTLAP